MVIWKQNMAHFPHIIKNVTPTTKKYTTFNLCTMGKMKRSRFPHSTELRYKKKHAQFSVAPPPRQKIEKSQKFPGASPPDPPKRREKSNFTNTKMLKNSLKNLQNFLGAFAPQIPPPEMMISSLSPQ